MWVVFRVDASITMGIGHVMRCLTLADELKHHYVATTFITRAHQGHMADTIRKQGHDVILLTEQKSGFSQLSHDVAHTEWLGATWEQDAEETITAIGHKLPDWLIVDHYAIGAMWHQKMRSSVGNIAVIDDLADRPLDCDLLLDQTYGRTKAEYLSIVHTECRLLLGGEYALLRPEFPGKRSLAKSRRCKSSGILRILVSMGGMDPGNITGKVLGLLSHLKWATPLTIDVVLGGRAPHLYDIEKQAEHHPLNVMVSKDVKDMSERILLAELAIGASGATTWERCCLGLPTLTIPLAKNQERIAYEVDKIGAAVSLGYWNDGIGSEITRWLHLLERGEKSLQEMSDSCFGVTDGLGVNRVLDEMGCL